MGTYKFTVRAIMIGGGLEYKGFDTEEARDAWIPPRLIPWKKIQLSRSLLISKKNRRQGIGRWTASGRACSPDSCFWESKLQRLDHRDLASAGSLFVY